MKEYNSGSNKHICRDRKRHASTYVLRNYGTDKTVKAVKSALTRTGNTLNTEYQEDRNVPQVVSSKHSLALAPGDTGEICLPFLRAGQLR